MTTKVMDLVSDFGQIQIYDDEEFDGDELDWTAESMAEFASFGDQCAGLQVIENDDHKIPVSVMAAAPEADLSAWDHIVEVPFECLSSKITIADEEFDLPAGNYTVRWSIKKTGEFSGNYQLDFIAQKSSGRHVLKQMPQ